MVIWWVFGAVLFLGFVVVHEVGHYAAGRLIGVPAEAITVRWTPYPGHVALADEHGRWYGPDEPEYQDVYVRHDSELRWLGWFISAGFVLQTAVALVLTALLIGVGADASAARVVRVSIVLNGLYWAYDLAVSLLQRSPGGDLSALAVHRPWAAVGTLLFLGGGHVAGWAVAF